MRVLASTSSVRQVAQKLTMSYDDQDELEEELLAVAGRSKPQSGKKRSRKAAESSDEDYEEEERRPSRKSVPLKKRHAPEPVQDESGEELGSDIDDGYGSDLMGDEEDRARLASMNELEREMELADRSERRDKELERRRTARMLKQQQRSTAKASAMRSSTRQRGTDAAKKSAMAELVAAKNARARKTSIEESKRKKKQRAAADEDEEVSDESEYEVSDRSERGQSPEDEPPSSPDHGRDRSRREEDYSDGEVDEDEEEDGVITREGQLDDSEDAELGDVVRIQVRRVMLEKWHNEPFFERSLVGAVVRLAVGSNRYFMAEILHVEERPPGLHRDPGIYKLNSPYEFPQKGGKIHKWLYVQRGTSPRYMPMTLVSNHTITEDEFRSWRNQCDKDKRPQISIADVAEAADKLKKAATYVYTAEDVTKMVEDKRAAGNVRNLAKEKSRLVVRRAKALEDNDGEEVERMDAAIAELDVKLEQRNQKERDRLEQEREKDKGKKSLAEVNKQNALRNMENALKNVSSRPDGARGLNAEGIDPFSRRPTRPMSYWSTKRRSSATDLPEEEMKAAGEELQDVDMETETEAPTATAVENEAGGIDLNIDLSALHEFPAAALLTNRLLGPRWIDRLKNGASIAGKKVLSLSDYKRRQGIV